MEAGKGLASGQGGNVQEAEDEARIAAVQEQIEVGVEAVQTGALRVRRVRRQQDVDVPVTLRREQAIVRRVAVNRQVEAEFGPRQEGDTLIIPVFEYVPVTEMRLMLKEEIHIQKHTEEEQNVQTVQVRSDDLIVERREGADGEWVLQDDSPTDT